MARANTSSASSSETEAPAPATAPAPSRPKSPKRSPPPRASYTQHGRLHEGVFAINKPTGITSAQVLRNLQTHFNPSSLFAPLIASEVARLDRESRNQRKKRSSFKTKLANQVKLGHGGTLDPLATGVLIVGVGKGTKELHRFSTECTKSYECVVLFGAATDTYDVEGKVVGRRAYEHVTRELVESKLDKFRGRIMQTPPIYSAISVRGKRLYEYAREGQQMPAEVTDREMEVVSLEVVEWMEGGTHGYKWPEVEAPVEDKVVAERLLGLRKEETGSSGGTHENGSQPELKRKRSNGSDDAAKEPPEHKKSKDGSDEPMMSGALQPEAVGQDKPPPVETTHTHASPPAARIRMTVTSGFYVRSFCHDLGATVGSLAMMSELVRLQQAEFSLDKGVLEFSDLEKGEEHWGPKVEALLRDWNSKHR